MKWVASRRHCASVGVVFYLCFALSRALLEDHAVLVKHEDHCSGVANRTGHHLLGTLKLVNTYCLLAHNEGAGRSKRAAFAALADEHEALDVLPQTPQRRVKRDGSAIAKRSSKTPLALPWRDPLYQRQWYLRSGAVGNYDMNVRAAWQLGYSGKGSVVTILDDGIQLDHADLAQNYDPMASSDINDKDDDPTPQDNGDNKHGTRCAGEVAAVAGNDQCGVGVAFDARIGGVRMLDGPVSDSVEAAALSLNPDHIEVYSASWGPEDDGLTMDGPGPLAREAFYSGITTGRGGLGSIFVWASGNGGAHRDSCSCDGYTTSIFTLSISAATYDNHRPWYLEECPSTIATTYSSGSMSDPAIVTTDVPSGCTEKHTGTSASAPLAAGIIALILEANRNLTWRDVQHVVLRTAKPDALLDNPGWSTNGIGRKISNMFGYGLMDAGDAVKLAARWRTVPEQHQCTYEYELGEPNPRPLEGKFHKNFTISVEGCSEGTPVLYLEHVQAVVTARFSKRGDIKISLVSPSGTRSVMLPPRVNDMNRSGFHKWPFLTVQMWGEDPRGQWTLVIENAGSQLNTGTFHDWSLLLYGTATRAQSTDDEHVPAAWPTSSGGSAEPVATPQVVAIPRRAASFSGGVGTWASGGASTGPSVGNCHSECALSGCHTAAVASGCYDCRHYKLTMRNRDKCVAACDDGFYTEGVHCKQCARVCRSCSDRELCDSCHPGMLLVDADWGHFHHGQCVESCPEDLVRDDSDSKQPKCVRPTNICGPRRYYDNRHSTCLLCHEACADCRDAGPHNCVVCAGGYLSVHDYCRPCCVGNETQAERHCVDCAAESARGHSRWFDSGWDVSLAALLILVVACVALALYLCVRRRQTKKWAYSRLPARFEASVVGGAKKGAPNGIEIISDSDSSDADDDDDVAVHDSLRRPPR